MLGELINDLLIILAAGLVAGLVCRALRISVLIGYLIVGALLGDHVLRLVPHEQHDLEHIAEAGVFFLLFSIGLEFSLEELFKLGRNLLIGGSAQMLLVAVPVTFALKSAGIETSSAVLIASAVSFSSTVLVFKALSEWGQSSTRHGRRAIGVLLFQDAALIPLLLLLPLLTGEGESVTAGQIAILALKSLAFVSTVIGLRTVLARWIISRFANYRSPELVILFTLTLLGAVTLGAYKLGLPAVVGAFAAGLVLSGNRWAKQIDALILPFRESFAAVFFVSLGLLFNPLLLWQEPLRMLGLFVGLIVVKAVAATIAIRLTGLKWRESAGMGIGLAHVGEFAFVLLLLGMNKEMIEQTHYQRIVALTIGSLITTPMLLKAGLRWATSSGGTSDKSSHGYDAGELGQQAVVIGAGPIGRQVTSRLETAGKDVCLIDFSPINLHPFAQMGFRTVAGDATKDEVLALANISTASIIVVCIPDDESAVRIVKQVREMNPTAFVVVRCRYLSMMERLERARADRVISEEIQASEALIRILDAAV